MSTKCFWAASLLAAAISPVSATTVKAQTGAPDSISVQGYLTDTAGVTVPDGSYSVRFRLYRDGTSIWQEVHPNVTVEHGVFNELLGGMTTLATIAFNEPLQLGMKVGADPEISPRTPLAAVPYAKALPGMYTMYWEDNGTEGYNIIGGWPSNFVGLDVPGATIAGGGGRLFGILRPDSVVGAWGTVGGGIGNRADVFATVGGGIRNKATGARATVGGGGLNTARDGAVVSGGEENTASGDYSSVPGGFQNLASGSTSFAAGYRSKAVHDGSFIWADKPPSQNDSLESTGPNQFLIRAKGGVGIGTNSPKSGSQLDVGGPIYAGGETLLFTNTSASGTLNQDDGVRFRYDGDFGGPSNDYLIVEKTDANQNAPDGGVAFVNTGADGVVETALLIAGNGSVNIPGTLTKGSGSFKIDHPLDPTNKFLFHSFVESPDMKNVYDGVIVLDERGEAEVVLPSYFEALNRDFRYQLTAIGEAAPNLHVSSKISENRFGIAGGTPGMEVSWQVTGIRHDPFAVANPIEVEVDKGPAEQGTYLHPAAYGASH